MKVKMLYTVREAAEASGIGRTKLYELLAAGLVESVTIGRSRYIPADALEEFIARLRAGQVA